MKESVTFDMVAEAARALKGVAALTPVVSAARISENIFFKAENLQKTGSFKLRGAYNKIRLLTAAEAKKGVIACSAGNHAQGVAISATSRGIRSVVCMPAGAPVMKIEATKGYGAEVVAVRGNYDDAAAEAARLSQENGLVFIHPFDDPYVIAGQGTVGLEIIEQMPDVEQIVVPVGGGGLVSGVAVAVKALKPDCRVIGVQAAGVPSMYGSVARGEIITVPDAGTVADGIHVLTPGRLTYGLTEKYVDDIVTVTEDEICAAIVRLLEGPKLVAEGAGASATGAFLFGKLDTSKKTVCVVSGGNVDIRSLDKIITKGSIRLGRLAEIAVEVPNSPEGIAGLVEAAAGCGAVVTDVRRDRFLTKHVLNSAAVGILVETADSSQIAAVRAAIAAKGFRLLN